MNEIPSMGLAVEPVVFNTIYIVFDLEKENENNVSCRKYNRKKYEKYCTDLMPQLA